MLEFGGQGIGGKVRKSGVIFVAAGCILSYGLSALVMNYKGIEVGLATYTTIWQSPRG